VRPESRKKTRWPEFVRGGLRDISVSRMTVKWGIGPDDPKARHLRLDRRPHQLHDRAGGPAAVETGSGKGAFWPVAHHLIAKDLLRFHTVYGRPSCGGRDDRAKGRLLPRAT